jgi:hypothetical protein
MALAESQRSVLTHSLALGMLAGEALAAHALCVGEAAAAGLYHLIGVLGAVAVSAVAVRPRSRVRAAACAAILVMTLPLLGAFGFAIVVLPQWRRGSRARSGRILTLELPGAADGDSCQRVPEGVVPIRSVLSIAPSVRLRVDAVMALRRMDARKAVPLLRLAFSDSSEDVRLLAFAILERREKVLRSRIQASLRELANESRSLSVAAGARLHQRLAQDYWELVYGGFVSGDGEARTLEAAAEQARLALEVRCTGSLALLLTRILLRQRDIEGAREWLARAEAVGVAPAVCAPLLGEAAYLARRFRDVPRCFERVPKAQLRRAGLLPLVEFWLRESAP